MGVLDKLFGKKKGDERAPSRPAAAVAGEASGSKGETSRIYMYLATSKPVDFKTDINIRMYALKLLEADAAFRRIWAKAKEDGIAQVQGGGVASPDKAAKAFEKWLQKEGSSLAQATTVMGKSLFVQGGDAQNPADGSKFSWVLIGMFQLGVAVMNSAES